MPGLEPQMKLFAGQREIKLRELHVGVSRALSREIGWKRCAASHIPQRWRLPLGGVTSIGGPMGYFVRDLRAWFGWSGNAVRHHQYE